MITNIVILLEELSILLCIHYLYGEKFKFDIYTTSYLVIYMIIMSAINYYKLPGTLAFVTYLFIVLYCGVRFGFKWQALVINTILYIVIISAIQLMVSICYALIIDILSFNEVDFRKNEILIINISVLFIVLVILPKWKINKLSVYLQNKEKILILVLIFSILFSLASLINFKLVSGIDIQQSFLLFLILAIFSLLAGQLGKYKIRSKEVETELRMNQLYAESFHNLIDDIRLRQHEFDNHISTIYSLHYTCDSYEKLVKAQNEYSQEVIKENRYNKLLKAGNPLLIGFLYGKFIEIERLGIFVDYQIDIENLNVGIPVYKLVEILGNLLKNAVEAMQDKNIIKKLYVMVKEKNGVFEIETRNRSEIIDYNEIENFFKRGYSKKGNNRGLGLYNVKSICNEYSLTIFCENKSVNDESWLCFTISNKKETI